MYTRLDEFQPNTTDCGTSYTHDASKRSPPKLDTVVAAASS